MKSDQRKLYVAKRIVPVTGEINVERFSDTGQLIEDLLLSGAPDILAIISSGGGDVNAGLDIYDLLNTYPGKITGVVYRRAASMGAIVLQACDERCCAKHADILIHHISRSSVSLDVFDDPSKKKWNEMAEKLRSRQKYLYDILTSRTKKTLQEIKEACLKDEPMSAEQAIQFGLVDRVLTRDDMTKWFKPLAEQK